ncbi:unnamed protein product [Amoebophrya sp. A25]|nr:unnamed protein product [Amoebophrya sp. A25]|eukprot:GSA25T00025235001.1
MMLSPKDLQLARKEGAHQGFPNYIPHCHPWLPFKARIGQWCSEECNSAASTRILVQSQRISPWSRRAEIPCASPVAVRFCTLALFASVSGAHAARNLCKKPVI